MKINPTIGIKLFFWFLLVSLVPLLGAGYKTYQISENTMKQKMLDDLSALAQSKNHNILRYVLERERDVTTLSRNPTVIEALERFNKAIEDKSEDSEYEAIDRELRPFLTYYKEVFGFSDLILASPKGVVVFSVIKQEIPEPDYTIELFKESELAKAFDRSITLMETEISDFEAHPLTREPAAFIASPVYKKGSVLGAVILQMNKREFFSLVQDYTGLGETGEVVLVSRKDREAVFVTPSRHDSDAALSRSVSMGSQDAHALLNALRGERGSGVTWDYRGKEVLAVWRYIPHLRWGMVVKIDTEEAFKPIRHLRNWFIFIGTITVAGVILLTLYISRSITEPIVQLTRITETIVKGNLDKKIVPRTNDEIGLLARSFNKMVEDLKRSQDSLHKRTLELERSNKDLEQFAYVASHDLQNPLVKIQTFGDLLKSKCGADINEKGQDYLDRIVRTAARMQTLIKDLLTLSRVSIQAQPFSTVDLNSTVKEVLSALEVNILKSGAEVKMGYLPTIEAEPTQMFQLFQNLISNSLKFSRDGHPPFVKLHANVSGDICNIFVEDNGIGFEEKYLDRIFGVFQRLHGEDEYGGTGIGLSICKKIVERHGGTITANSDPGEGTIFIITLPLIHSHGGTSQ